MEKLHNEKIHNHYSAAYGDLIIEDASECGDMHIKRWSENLKTILET
jgi:hypothetical protein